MPPARLHKRILRWGNSYGVRLTKDDLERLHLREDDPVDIELEPCRPDIDWDNLPDFGLGPDASLRHDEIIEEGLDEDLG